MSGLAPIVAFLLFTGGIPSPAIADDDNPSNACTNSSLNDCDPLAVCYSDSPTEFECSCPNGFTDVSEDHTKPGRKCRKVVDECALGIHFCDPSATCIDTEESYTCQCPEGSKDISDNLTKFPGRKCLKETPQKGSPCKVDDPLTCNTELLEVCTFQDGIYRCACPPGISRLPDGRCKLIDECMETKLNDCSKNADCIDLPDSYTCACKSGFADLSISKTTNPGRICRPLINECEDPEAYGVDCDANAECQDTDQSFTCKCVSGYVDVSESYNKLPGRHCAVDVNECLDPNLNSCSENAVCEDAKVGYMCSCKSGFVDLSPNVTHYPGRMCIPPSDVDCYISHQLFSFKLCDPQSSTTCREDEVCASVGGVYLCSCQAGSKRNHDGSCKVVNACDSGLSNRCDPNAICSNNVGSYTCQCKPGYIDTSDDPVNFPGRKCKQLINECADRTLNDCSPFAECTDTMLGYACACRSGYIDASPLFGLASGRKCFNTTNECSLRTLNTCDDNADCIDTPSGYVCQCVAGYIDVSNSAQLPPGRVCTIQTYCPSQPTDLMFLLDGSGSIGANVFRNDILRFIIDLTKLFVIAPSQTRAAVIQYSDQIRHEIEFRQTTDLADLEDNLRRVDYLTGLTRTGSALSEMVNRGFSESYGARPTQSGVHRVAMVITDGRSQDSVGEAAARARKEGILMFCIGVTDHVLESELIDICGSRQRVFLVKQFSELNVRLRSLIQKAACPPVPPAPRNATTCLVGDSGTCDRSKNEVCVAADGETKCICPEPFERHPVSDVCGGELCNPDLGTSCPNPEVCAQTPLGNHRCICPDNHRRMLTNGQCVSRNIEMVIDEKMPVLKQCEPDSCAADEQCVPRTNGGYECVCAYGLVRRLPTGKCDLPGACDDSSACDTRRHEECLPDRNGRKVCQCPPFSRRDPATKICLINECLTGKHDCDKVAYCIDTPDSYICQCPSGYIDQSPNPQRAGRVCTLESNDFCDTKRHNCSVHARCISVVGGYLCQCDPGYIDFSPNMRKFPGTDCRAKVNECQDPLLNSCSRNATCIDTEESYMCMCKPGYTDRIGHMNPGRICEILNVNSRCQPGNNDCDANAKCFPKGDDDFFCVCPAGYVDRSPNPLTRPGRRCIPLVNECSSPTTNDCDHQNGLCIEKEEGYECICKPGFIDRSPDPQRPGRVCAKVAAECQDGTHDCDPFGAICEDTPNGYTCRCAPGFMDVSPDSHTKPGRRCRQVQNECAEGYHDCSDHARCIDTPDSYTCACNPGFHDISVDPNRPGRSCLRLINECKNSALNDCSRNALCKDTVMSYQCQCKEGFDDISPDAVNRPGRECIPKKRNECLMNEHDCSVNAECIDTDNGYTCHCNPGFMDKSPNAAMPGRVCVAILPPAARTECSIEDIRSCSANVNEICSLIDGKPQCVCSQNYERNPSTDQCTMVNECAFFYLNDCSPNADCIDQESGYSCQCKPGFKDASPDATRPGRICQPLINECAYEYLNQCHQNAECVDLEDGYTCRCKPGYMDIGQNPDVSPGRVCYEQVDECAVPSLNNCDRNARCIDEVFGYRCECNDGFMDISPTANLRGRVCKKVENECESGKHECDPSARCEDTLESYRCICPPSSTDISPNPLLPGRVCRKNIDECQEGMHDCDNNAICEKAGSSFICICRFGFLDRSPPNRPGRICIKLVNECEDGTAVCSPNASCRDLEDGYTCQCNEGYIDRSPVASQPGKVCKLPDICPANNDCSAAAVCEPTSDGQYTCTCMAGYKDRSPEGKPGRVCIKESECLNSSLNNCSPNAVCYDLSRGHRCECFPDYVDMSPDPNVPGIVCEKRPKVSNLIDKKHPCQDSLLNDCSLLGSCKSLGTEGEYTCECPPGYADQSPDPVAKPGRICVPQPPICLDSSRNDCHRLAICIERGNGNYDCKCRDGYVDLSMDKDRPGRICREKINECLDASLNDCSPHAVCKDLDVGYDCQCLPNYIDISEGGKRGKKCRKLVNECQNPLLHNCSRFADCKDLEIGYECRCRSGYHDLSPSTPGRKCSPIINECESANLNDCDRHAICKDLVGGYSCQCPPLYRDESPDPDKPGRICRLNECDYPNLSNCDPNAICKDTDESYVCYCPEGFVDVSSDPMHPGQVCHKIVVADHNLQQLSTTAPTNMFSCGRHFCNPDLGEFCIGGTHCGCRPGYERKAPGFPCEPVTGIQIPLRILRRNNTKLTWSNTFAIPESPRRVEIESVFVRGIEQAARITPFSNTFVTSKVSSIIPPRLYNPAWTDGLLFNYTIYVKKGKVSDPHRIFEELKNSFERTNYSIGGTDLYIDPNQFATIESEKVTGKTIPCGDGFCDFDLGEVCSAERMCVCPYPKIRASSKEKCVDAVPLNLPLWIARRNETMLKYNATFSNPLSPNYKEITNTFIDGARNAFSKTYLVKDYVGGDVNEILNPEKFNGTWRHGLLFNFTGYFLPGIADDAFSAWNALIRSCLATNYSLGGSDLYINPLQPFLFNSCQVAKCKGKAECFAHPAGNVTCHCSGDSAPGHPIVPGKKCPPIFNFNECKDPNNNDCSPNADCIDEEYLYRCKCKPGYIETSPLGSDRGHVCDLDYCLDLPFCPENTTCVNMPEIRGARCKCKDGFIDIRSSPVAQEYGQDVFCLAETDVNECLLELTNCSSVALCNDERDGYSCNCPPGYIDGNPSMPGRICAGASCDLCNQHGDCLQDAGSSKVYCRCHSWYTGEFCDKDTRVILAIIFAVLFLLLTVMCLLYFCMKCHCVRKRNVWYRSHMTGHRKDLWPWSTLGETSSSESNAGFSAMSTSPFGIERNSPAECYPDITIPRAKLIPHRTAKFGGGGGTGAVSGGAAESSRNAQTLSSFLQSNVMRKNDWRRNHDTMDKHSYASDNPLRMPAVARRVNSICQSECESRTTESSDSTYEEETIRRVTTDVKRTTTTKTTMDGGNSDVESLASYSARSEKLKSDAETIEESYTVDTSDQHSRTVTSSGGVDEKDRGQSVMEFRNGNMIGKERAGHSSLSSTHFAGSTQKRSGLSKYLRARQKSAATSSATGPGTVSRMQLTTTIRSVVRGNDGGDYAQESSRASSEASGQQLIK